MIMISKNTPFARIDFNIKQAAKNGDLKKAIAILKEAEAVKPKSVMEDLEANCKHYFIQKREGILK